MNRHTWREVKRQMRESGPAGLVAILLVTVATTWGGVLVLAKNWVGRELTTRQAALTMVAVLGSDADATLLASDLKKKYPNTQTGALTPGQVRDELSSWFPELASGLNAMSDQVFPPLLRITAPTGEESAITAWLRQRKEVSLVESSRAWQSRLDQTLSPILVAGFTLTVALLLACCVVVLLVVRLLVMEHSDEIAVMRLIGAREWDIRLPYLACGGLLGAGGGVLGVVTFQALVFLLRGIVPTLPITNLTTVLLPFAGAITGIVGASLGLASLPKEP